MKKKGLAQKKVNEWHLLVVAIILFLAGQQIYQDYQRASNGAVGIHHRGF